MTESSSRSRSPLQTHTVSDINIYSHVSSLNMKSIPEFEKEDNLVDDMMQNHQSSAQINIPHRA